jgi:hypothetical protein
MRRFARLTANVGSAQSKAGAGSNFLGGLLAGRSLLVLAVVLVVLMPGPTATATGATLLVPADYPTIQSAVDAAVDGDTVLVAPGTYGPVTIDGKNVTLASEFLETGDPASVTETVIDGGNGEAALTIANTDTSSRIIGFSFQNANDGVVTYDAHFQFLNNIVQFTGDGIDYESSGTETTGGLVRDSVFQHNTDDGIDLDDTVDIVIEDSIMRNNGNDGIEIRLPEYTGPTANVMLRSNQIYANNNDGIQLIGYPEPSNRSFVIERNLIHDNGDAGIGLMDNAETVEDFRGAPLTDPILVANNTFDNNAWAQTGGANTTFVNNAVLNSVIGGLKNLTGASTASYSGFWENTIDTENVILGPGLLFSDPLMNPDYTLSSTSPYIDSGDPTCTTGNGTPCDIGRFEFGGSAPVAIDDTATTDEGTPVAIDVVANDADPDGNLDLATLALVTVPVNGSVVVESDGTVTYTPDPGFSGTDGFVYEICDTDALCDTAAVSIVVGQPSIVLDAVSSGTASGSSLTVSHTTSGSNRLMLVGVSINNDNFETVASVVYGGVPLTHVGSETQSDDARVEIWGLVDPPVGTHDVVITFSADLKRFAVAGVATFGEVDLSDPLGTFSGNNSTSSSATVTVATAPGEMLFGVFSCETCNSVGFSSPADELWNLTEGGGDQIGAGAVVDSKSLQETIGASLGKSDHWALAGIPIRPTS